MLANPAVCKCPLCTQDALYVWRAETMHLLHKARESVTIQYVDIMSIYPYICMYFTFTVGNPFIHAGGARKD